MTKGQKSGTTSVEDDPEIDDPKIKKVKISTVVEQAVQKSVMPAVEEAAKRAAELAVAAQLKSLASVPPPTSGKDPSVLGPEITAAGKALADGDIELVDQEAMGARHSTLQLSDAIAAAKRLEQANTIPSRSEYIFPPGFNHDRPLTSKEEQLALAKLYQLVYHGRTHPTKWNDFCTALKAAASEEDYNTMASLLRGMVYASDQFIARLFDLADPAKPLLWSQVLELMTLPGDPIQIPQHIRDTWSRAAEEHTMKVVDSSSVAATEDADDEETLSKDTLARLDLEEPEPFPPGTKPKNKSVLGSMTLIDLYRYGRRLDKTLPWATLAAAAEAFSKRNNQNSSQTSKQKSNMKARLISEILIRQPDVFGTGGHQDAPAASPGAPHTPGPSTSAAVGTPTPPAMGEGIAAAVAAAIGAAGSKPQGGDQLNQHSGAITMEQVQAMVVAALGEANRKRPGPDTAVPQQVSIGVEDVEDNDDSWDQLKHVTPIPSAKVQLPPPPQFTGTVDKLVPTHYTKLENYPIALCRLALRDRFPLQEVVMEYFKQNAAVWAEQFFSSDITTKYGVSQDSLGDASKNEEVYKAFHKAFMKQFSPQIRSKRDMALEQLHGTSYKQQANENVATYYSRFATIADEAQLTPTLKGFYFRKGLLQHYAEKCIADAAGKKLETLDDVYNQALLQEHIRVTVNNSPAPLAVHYSQSGRGGGRGRGRSASGSTRGGRDRGRGRAFGRGRGGRGQARGTYAYPEPDYYGKPRGKPLGRSSGVQRGVHKKTKRGRGRGRGALFFVEDTELVQQDNANPPGPPNLSVKNTDPRPADGYEEEYYEEPSQHAFMAAGHGWGRGYPGPSAPPYGRHR